MEQQSSWKSFYARNESHAIYVCLLLLGIGSCLSEPFSRNCVRCILALTVLSICLGNKSVLWTKLKPYRWFIGTMAGLMGVLFVSAWYGGHFYKVVTENNFWYQYSMLLLIPAVLFLKHPKQIMRIVDGCCLSLFLMNFYIYWQAYQGVGRPLSPEHGSAMLAAMFYVLLLPIGMLQMMEEANSKKRRLVYLCFTVCSVIAFLLTNTRGAWLAVIPVAVYAVAAYGSFTWRRFFLVMMAILLMVGVVLCVPRFSQRVQTIGDLRDQSQSERLLMYRSAVRMIADHPVFGIGMGNYERQYLDHYMLPEAKERNHQHAHNVFLQFTIQAGIFGLITYCLMFGYILYWAWRHRNNVFGMMLFCSTGGLLLYGLTDYTFAGYGAMRLYYLLLGVCAKGVMVSDRAGEYLC